MMCFEGALTSPVFLGIVAVCSVAAFVMLWMLRYHRFFGKAYYALTFVAVIWTLLAVGLEAASGSQGCQLLWAILAWPGNALVPISWCFFVFAYIENPSWLSKRRVSVSLIIVPSAIFALAATNPWHHLVYTEASVIPPGETQIDYTHGPVFYAFIATLYAFVFATLFCLAKAFLRAKRSAWPLLTILTVITITPLAGNIAYVVFSLTVFGLDPTAFMFTVGILAYTWLLATNQKMDMAFVGQSHLFDTMSEPVILIDRFRKIVRMNSAAKRSKLLLDTKCLVNDMIVQIENVDKAAGSTHINAGQRIYEPRIQEIESPLDPNGTVLGWSITFVDITERLAITSALEKALERADDAVREKNDFLSMISHELRTPLTSLKGGLGLALSGHLGDLTGPVRSSLEIANRSGERLSQLIENLLLAQKMDVVALSLKKTPIDFEHIVDESLEENRTFAIERGIQLKKPKSNQSATIIGDAFALRQIVDNVISNAVKFSNEKGVVEVVLTIANGRVRLSIKDNGEGIPENMEKVVFGRFEQVPSDRQGSTEGSGLGLHISRQLVTQMDGDIFYESQIGLGTTFYVEFPAAAEQSDELALLAG